MKKLEFKGIKFLIIIATLYGVLFIADFDNSSIGFFKSIDILWNLLPIFCFIIILTALINYFLKPKQIMKHFGKDSSKKSIFYTLIGGILSHGPMYAWYGMLSDMRNHGLRDGLIATFIYARAVKLPLLPFMIDIFGLTFTIVINIYILIFSVFQGKIIDIFTKFNSRRENGRENIGL